MSERSFMQRRWKLIVNIITIGALVVLVVLIRHQLATTIKNFSKVNLWALLLIIPIEIWNYDAQTRIYKGLFAIVGDKLPYKFWFKIAVELNFINSVFPSGGVSGISYLGMRLRRDEIRAGRAALVQLMKLVLIFFSFEVLLVVGVIMLAVAGRVDDITMLIATSVTTLMFAGTAAFIYIISSRERIGAFFTFATKGINWLIRTIFPKHPEAISIERMHPVFDELHENYSLFRNQYRDLRGPFFSAIFANLTEILAIYVVYIAFGHWVNIGAVILAYAVANFAGLVSVLPGGVGVYEALMTATLVAGGIPAALSIPVVVMYRIVNAAIQLPPGYIFYHRTLHASSDDSIKV